MNRGLCAFYLFALAVVGQALTPSTYFTSVDLDRISNIFETAQPYKDVSAAYYSILGLKLLGKAVPQEQDACKYITSAVGDINKAESIFYAAASAKALSGCKLTISDNARQTLTTALSSESEVTDIYYAYFAMKSLAIQVDEKTVLQSLHDVLKVDDSPYSQGYAFHIAASLSGDVSKIFDTVEDVVAQADEVDEKYLQFEGGLITTALVVDGAYKLADKVKKAPAISQDKVVKFANYFMSRKHVQQMKSSFYLLSAVKTLTVNKYHIPIAVSRFSPVTVSQSSKVVQIRVTDLMGGSLGKLTVTADSARHLEDDAVVLSKKLLAVSKDDQSMYELNFMDVKPARGFYKLTLSIVPQKSEQRLIGISGAEIQVKVTTQVSVENVEVGFADKDQATGAKTNKLQHPNKAANIIEADFHQKIIMKFQLKDKVSGQLMTAHQSFVRLTNQKTKQEIIFVTESDSTNTNKFDLDVAGSAKDFGYLSGRYMMELIIGDAVIDNPFSWTVADLDLTFPETTAAVKEKITGQYKKKVEIKHMFSQEEKRPPGVVSTTFTVLVITPLLLLVILWLRLGVNVTVIPVSVSAIGFHVSLAAIFGLYYCYWTQLTMFQTLRWLGVLAVPTFLFGNRLLSGIAAKRK